MLRRRILIVSGAILVLVAVVGIALWLQGRLSGITGGDPDGTLPEIGGDFELTDPEIVPGLEEARLPVTNVAAYYVFPDSSVLVVHRDGTIDRVASSTTNLSSKPVENFASASFSGDGSRILVLTGNQPRTQVNIFEVETATWRVIPGTFRDAVWAPSGNQLGTLTPDAATGKTSIGIYDTTTGKTVRTVATLALGDVSISWPNAATMFIADKPTYQSIGSSWAVDVATGRVSIAARNRLGHVARWSPSGTTGVAFQTNPYGTGGNLVLMAGGLEQARLSFVTLPDKCTFFSMPSGSSTVPFLICGTPRDQRFVQTQYLPDAYYRREFFSDDVLVGINLDTRTVDFTIGPPVPVDIEDVRVVDSTVYYLNRANGELFKADI